jgi:nitrate/nitrite-specific signal transduction histidine kinase
VDAERLRIAREVHDTVAHAIAVINVQAGITAHVLDKRPHQARETLVVIEQTSAQALGELRATLGMLRETDQDAHTPSPGLARLEELAGLARQAGLDVKVEVAAPPTGLPSAIDQAAYRIAREAVTMPSGTPALPVTVSLTYGRGELLLLVATTKSWYAPASACCWTPRTTSPWSVRPPTATRRSSWPAPPGPTWC